MLCKDFKYPALMGFFEDISKIPRMSYHEEKIADHIVAFASSRGLEVYRDGVNNVLVNIGATEGYEDVPSILLQGHTDMVCECRIGVEHDFLRDGLELYVDEKNFLRARGTTLGADDGVAVAMMLALLDGQIPEHPACQCLFTSSEEVGLDGAKAFDYSKIFARRMINIDSASDSELIVGCAGGVRSDVTYNIQRTRVEDKTAIKITLGGLVGGHSGEDIEKGRANACKIMGALLSELYGASGDVLLVSFDGGSKSNAIPRDASAVLLASDARKISERVSDFKKRIFDTLCESDKNCFISCEVLDGASPKAMSASDTKRIIEFVNSVDNGVLKMSDVIDGFVEFSRNLGVVRTEGERIEFYFSSRSAIESQIDESKKDIDEKVAAIGATVLHHNQYPGWDYTGETALVRSYVESAKRVCGIDVKISAIHAGLECGFIKRALPDMDIIACGANTYDLHSPDEALELASFERLFEILSDMIMKK